MKDEFTPEETKLLCMLFKIANIIVETQGGVIELDSATYVGSNEMFNLACKLGIEDLI